METPLKHLDSALVQNSLRLAMGVNGREIQHRRFFAAEGLEAQLLPFVGHRCQHLLYLHAVTHLHHKHRALAFNDQLGRALGRGQPVVDAGAAALIEAVASEEKTLGQETVLG